MFSQLKVKKNFNHRVLILGLCLGLALMFCGCSATISKSPSTTSTSTSTDTGKTSATSATSTGTPSSTSTDAGVSDLDGNDATVVSETPTSTPTPTPSGTPTGSVVTGNRKTDLLNNLKSAGLSGENLRMAWSIAMAESGANPRAYNGNANTGDKSYGLFQINMLGAMGPERRRKLNISSNEELFDPQVNIRAMLMISSNCTNWRPWSVYKHGTYRKYYDQFPG